MRYIKRVSKFLAVALIVFSALSLLVLIALGIGSAMEGSLFSQFGDFLLFFIVNLLPGIGGVLLWKISSTE